MMRSRPDELQTEWARLLLGSLRAAGVRDVVINPGSRSTPFAWAALRDPGLSCRSIIDERSAAFFALGHARMTGRAVLLICTSGSAGAHYLPAVVEATESATPLLVLTADRPLELQRAAAPQTIDQVKLFGDQVRAYFELGTPDADPRMIRAVPRIAAQAVLATRHPLPGPVHLNARARKPLEPVGPSVGHAGPGRGVGAGNDRQAADQETRLGDEVDRLLGTVRPTVSPRTTPAPAAIDALVGAIREADRGLILCGPASAADAADPGRVTDLARATGFGVVAEAASQLRFAGDRPEEYELDAFGLLLEAEGFLDRGRPDLVVQVGRPPTASSWHAAIDRWDPVERYVLAPRGWPDPWGGAHMVLGPLTATIDALLDRLGTDPAPAGAAERKAWRGRLVELNRRAWRVVDESLQGGFSEGAAVRTVLERLEPGAVLALGNSLPIREADLFVPAGDRDIRVWAQRGANGIDGLLSGAAGAALASGRPVTLLVGDVSFLHDITGLAAARDLPAPLTVVVLNNGGGRIFERLPLVDTLKDDPALSAWLTPPALDFEAAARAFGARYARADGVDTLESALETARDRSAGGTGGESAGAIVIEVVVPEGGTTAHQRKIRRRIEAEAAG